MASSSSRTVSEEEVQKAREDLKGILAGVPDEFKSDVDFDDGQHSSKEEAEKKGKKKKKVKRMQPEVVEFILNFKPMPLPIHRALAEADKDKYTDLRAACSAIDVLVRNFDEQLRVDQEKIRRKLETVGYIEYEVTDDEDEDDNKGATMATQQGGRGGRRRTTPPGVTKQRAGGRVRKVK